VNTESLQDQLLALLNTADDVRALQGSDERRRENLR
jgi:hypothetical protein